MLLCVKEVAAILGISRDAVTRLIKNGELAAVRFPKMGGKGKNVKWGIEPEEVERFKDRNCFGGPGRKAA